MNFENDGCTFFPEGWGGLDWRVCCDVHDAAFANGTTWQEFISANVELWRCVAVHDIFAATLVVAGVMTGGAVLFFLGRKRRSR